VEDASVCPGPTDLARAPAITTEKSVTMARKLLVVGLVVVILGVAVSTVAAQSGDRAADGIYLNPANTSNGNAYASIHGTGQIHLDVSRLNERSVTTIDSVFTVTSTLDDETRIWIEPPSSAISFYRMDTGGPITSRSNAVRLSNGDTVTVGMRVDTRDASPTGGPVTVTALLPNETTPRPVNGGGGGVPAGGAGSPGSTPGAPGEPGDSPPGGGGPTPDDAGTENPGGTDAPPDRDATPSPEVGGFPWLPLLGLVAALVLLPLGFFAYRRLRSSRIRVEVPPESGLRVLPGAFPEDIYEEDDDAVVVSFEKTRVWADRDSQDPVPFDAVVTLENAGERPLAVGTDVTGRSPEAATVTAGQRTVDLRAEQLPLAPGETVGLSVALSADYDGAPVTIRCGIDGHTET